MWQHKWFDEHQPIRDVDFYHFFAPFHTDSEDGSQPSSMKSSEIDLHDDAIHILFSFDISENAQQGKRYLQLTVQKICLLRHE